MKRNGYSDPTSQRLRQLMTVLGLLDDLGRVERSLESDVVTEESKPATPLLKSLTTRRAKIRETIAALEQRLSDLRGAETA